MTRHKQLEQALAVAQLAGLRFQRPKGVIFPSVLVYPGTPPLLWDDYDMRWRTSVYTRGQEVPPDLYAGCFQSWFEQGCPLP